MKSIIIGFLLFTFIPSAYAFYLSEADQQRNYNIHNYPPVYFLEDRSSDKIDIALINAVDTHPSPRGLNNYFLGYSSKYTMVRVSINGNFVGDYYLHKLLNQSITINHGKRKIHLSVLHINRHLIVSEYNGFRTFKPAKTINIIVQVQKKGIHHQPPHAHKPPIYYDNLPHKEQFKHDIKKFFYQFWK